MKFSFHFFDILFQNIEFNLSERSENAPRGFADNLYCSVQNLACAKIYEQRVRELHTQKFCLLIVQRF